RYSDIISKLRPEAAPGGDIVHMDGRVLGHHDGIVHYTIGQRRGLGVATGEPLYVVYLDAPSARVIVGPREALDTHRLHLRDINWLGDGPVSQLPEEGFACFAKVRSTRPPAPAIAWWRDGTLSVQLTEGEAGIAPGQACVLYSSKGDDARVYGGGFIDRTERTADAEKRLQALLSKPAKAMAVSERMSS
ncbi:MAG: tRNA methyl transferase PRC-barrel domain-containing protein, partial [Pseudomonadota bacterium]